MLRAVFVCYVLGLALVSARPGPGGRGGGSGSRGGGSGGRGGRPGGPGGRPGGNKHKLECNYTAVALSKAEVESFYLEVRRVGAGVRQAVEDTETVLLSAADDTTDEHVDAFLASILQVIETEEQDFMDYARCFVKQFIEFGVAGEALPCDPETAEEECFRNLLITAKTALGENEGCRPERSEGPPEAPTAAELAVRFGCVEGKLVDFLNNLQESDDALGLLENIVRMDRLEKEVKGLLRRRRHGSKSEEPEQPEQPEEGEEGEEGAETVKRTLQTLLSQLERRQVPETTSEEDGDDKSTVSAGATGMKRALGSLLSELELRQVEETTSEEEGDEKSTASAVTTGMKRTLQTLLSQLERRQVEETTSEEDGDDKSTVSAGTTGMKRALGSLLSELGRRQVEGEVPETTSEEGEDDLDSISLPGEDKSKSPKRPPPPPPPPQNKRRRSFKAALAKMF